MSDTSESATATGGRLDVPSTFAEDLAAKLAVYRTEYEATNASAFVFRLCGENFAVPATSAQEVLPRPHIHRVPRAQNELALGIANFRGELLTCFSLRRILRLQGDEPSRLLVVLTWHGRSLGFPVDAAVEIRRFQNGSIRPRPSGPDPSGLVMGILELKGEVASVLSVDSLFTIVMQGVQEK